MDIIDSMVPSSKKEQPGSEEITVYVKEVIEEGDFLTFQVKLTDTVSTLIKKYKDMQNLGNAQVLIYCRGKSLNEGKTFKELDIEDGETFHSAIRLKGGY